MHVFTRILQWHYKGRYLLLLVATPSNIHFITGAAPMFSYKHQFYRIYLLFSRSTKRLSFTLSFQKFPRKNIRHCLPRTSLRNTT